jgi:hypothetical protein
MTDTNNDATMTAISEIRIGRTRADSDNVMQKKRYNDTREKDRDGRPYSAVRWRNRLVIPSPIFLQSAVR